MKTRYTQRPGLRAIPFLSGSMLLCLLFLHAPARAQVAEWTFENISSAVPSLPIAASSKIPQVRASADLSGGNNNGSPDVCSGAESWSTNFWPTGSSRSAGDYLEFSVRADPGETIDISYFSFSSSASSTSSALDFDVYYSKNNFTTSTFVFSGSHSTGGCSFHGGSLATVLLPNSTIRFRIYPYGQNLAAQAATIRIDDVSIDGALLPVTLTEFTAEEKSGQVLLQWTTATEINNEYFELQRSADGLRFDPIGWINGRGNSLELQTYQFVDPAPLKSDNYYRLRQVDFDGKATLHPVIQVQLEPDEGAALRIWPTVAHNRIRLRFGPTDNPRTVGVFALNGTHIHTWQLAADLVEYELDVSGLPPGWYLVHDQGTHSSSIGRFFKE